MVGRQVKLLKMAPGFVLALLKRLDGLSYVEVMGLPADAHAIDVGYDMAMDQFWMLVESREFPPVVAHQPVPHFDLMLSVPEVRHEEA